MNISLTPELESAVKAKVASGLYNNASEVIREALRKTLLQAQEETYLRRIWSRIDLTIGIPKRLNPMSRVARLDLTGIISRAEPKKPGRHLSPHDRSRSQNALRRYR